MSLNFRTFQSAGQISSHIIPGAYSRIDSVKGAAGLAAANNGVIMGRSEGGQPATLLQFNTVAEAVSALRSGELMEAVRLAFDPGGGLNPQRLFAMRVNTALQGSADLLDGSSNVMITLTSLDYGIYVNQIKILLETGLKKEDIAEICEMIAHHHSPGKIDTENFRILQDRRR